MLRIAYSGIEGCFAHTVARRVFPDELYVSFPDFTAAYDAVVSGDCDRAVLPSQNSYAGKVREVGELLSRGKLGILDTYALPVSQNLLGLRGSRPGDIKTVISQQKALEQCEPYIRSHGYAVITSPNTAVAAKEVIARQDLSFAAVAGLETAAAYGLKVLAENINETDDNVTTFVILTRTGTKEEDHGNDV